MKTFHYNGNQTYLCKSCGLTLEYNYWDNSWRDVHGNKYGPGKTLSGKPDGYHRHMPRGAEKF